VLQISFVFVFEKYITHCAKFALSGVIAPKIKKRVYLAILPFCSDFAVLTFLVMRIFCIYNMQSNVDI